MKTIGRILALDLGKKRIGVAVSDALQILARPVGVITHETDEKLFLETEKFIIEFDAVGLVIGLPLNFNGTESTGAEEARLIAAKFAARLEIPVALQDERLTSVEAEEILRERGVKNWREIKKRVDMEAAAVILRDFLAHREIEANRNTFDEGDDEGDFFDEKTSRK